MGLPSDIRIESALARARQKLGELKASAKEKGSDNSSMASTLNEFEDMVLDFLKDLEKQAKRQPDFKETTGVQLRRYKDLFELAPDGYLITDLNGRIKDANLSACNLLDMPSNKVLGKEISTFIDTHQINSFLSHFSHIRNLYGPYQFETEVKSISRSSFPAEFTVGIELDSLGRRTGIRWSIRDISRRREATQQELHQTRDEFEKRIRERTRRLEEANLALRDSEARLSEAQRIARLGNWELNTQDGRLFWSDEVHRVFGLDHQTQPPSHEAFVKVLHPDERQRVVDTLYQSLLEIRSCTFDFRILRQDGQERYIRSMSDVITDGRGHPVRMIGTFQDITEQKTSSERHRQTVELLEKVFTSIHLAIAYVDTDFNYIRVNQAYARDLDPDYFVGKNMFDLYPSEENISIFRKVVETGEPQAVFEQPFEFENQPERGTTYWDWSVQPVKEADDRVSGLVQCLIEVTARRRAEDDRNLLVKAIESSPEAIVITDREGKTRYANAAFERLTGYSRKEILGCDLHMLDSGAHDQEFFQQIRNTLRSAKTWSGRLVNRRKDGSLYQEECTIAPVHNASNQVMSYVSIKRDVTEQLRLESIAGAVDTMNNIGYIFSGIRHEIGNPVNAIRVTLTMLKSKMITESPAKLESYISRAQEEIGKIVYLLNSLRSFNLFEDPQIDSVNVVDFISGFKSLVASDCNKRGIQFLFSVHPAASRCLADPRALQQVLLNAFTNACDALSGISQPVIEISVSAFRKQVRFRMKDNGCGMTEYEREKVFQPFFTTKQEGTGFGLVVTKKLLTQMNGAIEISSQKDRGTTVDIFLPRA